MQVSRSKRFISIAQCLASLLFLAACTVQGESAGAYSGTLILEGRHVYAQGVSLPGVLVMLDGEVELAPGARVDGPVFLLGGVLIVAGEVHGDISAIGGRLVISPSAQVSGDLRVSSGELGLSPEATVSGRVLSGAASGMQPDDLFSGRSLQNQLLWLLPEALLLAIFALALMRFNPRSLGHVRRAAIRHPITATAMGLLGGVVGLILLVVMAFTLILIPITLLGFVIGFLAIGYGWAGIGVEVGQRLAGWRNWRLSQGATAFLGTFVFMLVLNLASLLPNIGSLIGILAAVMALGAVLLTRFGLREFIPESEAGRL